MASQPIVGPAPTQVSAARPQLDELRRRLAADDERYRVVFKDAPIGMVMSSLDGELLEINFAFVKLLGYGSADEVLAQGTFHALTHPDDLGDNLDLVARVKAGEISEYVIEKRYLTATGSVVWVNLSVSVVRDDDENPRLLIGQARDVTERRAAQAALELSRKKLAYHATHDSLTELPNRAALISELEATISGGGDFALLFMDLDRFKVVNDSLGHAAGDLLLIQVARRLRAATRQDDMLVRFGGDEFIVLMQAIGDSDQAVELARRLMGALEEPFTVQGRPCFVRASIGVVCDSSREDAHAVIADADMAMYRAKESGRGRIEVFDDFMQQEMDQRHAIDTTLRYGLLRSEFVLHYQPIVDIDTLEPIGFEALSRWEKPGVGLLEAPEFVPAAEDNGLIIGIGRWALGSACAQLASWTAAWDRTDLAMAVNVSGIQMSQPDIVRQVSKEVERSGIAPENLVLEITESVMLEDLAATTTTLKQLRDLGVKIALDDFGTGHSSLNYLRQLPLDVIKIDQSFTEQVPHDRASAKIVEMIVSVADELDCDVIAEGIESEAQLGALRAAGCRCAQGFLFARPKPAGAITPWVPITSSTVAAPAGS